jgi:hypothetical protein
VQSNFIFVNTQTEEIVEYVYCIKYIFYRIFILIVGLYFFMVNDSNCRGRGQMVSDHLNLEKRLCLETSVGMRPKS